MSTAATTARPASTWGLRILVGVLTAIVGVLVLAWPVSTLLIVAVLFGIELVVLGIIRIAGAVSVPMSRNLRILGVVLGVLTVLAGIFCFVRPGASLVVLAIFFAAGFIADGISDLVRVGNAGLSGSAKALIVVSGVISIIAGIVVALVPGASLVLLTQLSGAVLLVVGVVQVVSGVAARPARQRA